MANNEDIDQIINNFEKGEQLSPEECFDYGRICGLLLNNSKTEMQGRRLVINALENWEYFDDSAYEMWTDLIELAGFYPYLELEKDKLIFNNLPGEIRKELHKSKNIDKRYFHEDQKYLLSLLYSDKNVIVSAPTSFGKSLLIEEIIAANIFNNIVVIQPTLALLDETRRKLKGYRDRYKLIVRTSQMPSEDRGNIFLFTAERVNEYKQFPEIEFFVIDEFYKLSGKRDDERSTPLNNAFHYLVNNYCAKFYLLGPNIDDISPGFAAKYNAIFYKTNYSLVDSREINYYEKYRDQFGYRGAKKLFKEEILFKLLYNLRDEQTIVYCSSPNRVRELSKKFTNYLMSKTGTETKTSIPLYEWICKNVSEKWSLLNCLKYKVGIHDGALQKHITTSIIEYFNSKILNYLFCTTTIIEGVNTSAKNIIYFDKTKGKSIPIDYFDYSNIKGRAGRMMEHYIGKIYNFNSPPKQEKIIIDIPFFQQDPIKDEVLIQLEEDEVNNKESEQYVSIQRIPIEEREVIKRNGVSVRGQKAIINKLRTNIENNYPLIFWTNYPKSAQLKYCLTLAWHNLLIPGESFYPVISPEALCVNLSIYGRNKSIMNLAQNILDYISSDKKQRVQFATDVDKIDEAIRRSFQILKHWFQYKVPKWLSVVNELQKFVCKEKGLEPGNYSFYANLIENDFIKENLAILYEYGIPRSAISKIENLISNDIEQDMIFEEILRKNIHKDSSFLEYERLKIEDNL